jgi:hypothetical protein
MPPPTAPLLKALDVIWVQDDLIRPPGPKMLVCIEPNLGMFFRINTKPIWQNSIAIIAADHNWLRWDSNIECGEPIELDEYVISDSLVKKGIIGRVKESLAPAIYAVVANARTLAPDDKDAIREALGL